MQITHPFWVERNYGQKKFKKEEEESKIEWRRKNSIDCSVKAGKKCYDM